MLLATKFVCLLLLELEEAKPCISRRSVFLVGTLSSSWQRTSPTLINKKKFIIHFNKTIILFN